MARLFFLEEWGRALIPEKIRPHLRSYLLKAGIGEVNYKFFGALFYISLAISLIFYFYLPYSYLRDKSVSLIYTLIYLGVGSFIVVAAVLFALAGLIILCIYFYLDIRIYKRTREIEEILPDFLQFVSGNLKGGMSFDRALWGAIKPRFGVLAAEIEIVAKKVMTGGDVDKALTDFTKQYDSPILKRSFGLIVEGMKGGAEIAGLIDKVIENIKETQTLKKEMAASVTTYTIFITFIVIIVAPGLFGLSFQLLNIVSSFASKLGAAGGGGGQMPIRFAEVSVNPDDFKMFSRGSLGIIAVFSAMIISIIKRGDIKGGVKYIPVFLVISLINYEIFYRVLSNLFAFIG